MTIEYLRQFRLFNFAIFDLTVSFLGILILSPLLTRFFRLFHLDIGVASWMFFTLPIGIIVHIMVGNYTPMAKNFLDPSGHYLLKVVIILLIILGIKGVKLIK